MPWQVELHDELIGEVDDLPREVQKAAAAINLPLCFFASPRTMAALPEPLEEVFVEPELCVGGGGGGAAAAEFAPDEPAAAVAAFAELKFSAVLTCALLEPESRCRRRRSVRKSAAVWYRMVRSFSSDLLMMRSSSCGTSGLMRTGATGARFRMASNTAAEVEPEKAWRPVAISYSTTPSEKISVRESRSLPRVCSGDMYATVPTAMPGLVRLAPSKVTPPDSVRPSLPGTAMIFARPKSRIFVWPRSVRKIFAGLMSR